MCYNVHTEETAWARLAHSVSPQKTNPFLPSFFLLRPPFLRVFLPKGPFGKFYLRRSLCFETIDEG